MPRVYETMRRGGQVAEMLNNISTRSLIAQWRAAREINYDREHAKRQCADELEQALKPLADLEAEMRRFAEDGWLLYREVNERREYETQALRAWAARLKALR